jgi:DNA-binding transcriptional MocR family regulator
VPYRNAGMYIWINLGKYLTSSALAGEDGVPDLSVLSLSPSDTALYQDREMSIVRRCMKNGVWIGHGSNFMTEELGWFRLTFTAVMPALEAGLDRILKTLQEIESSGWSEGATES